MERAVVVPGWEGDDAHNDDLTTATVISAHVATVLHWLRQRRAARSAVQRPRYRGSVPGRAANCRRDFALGLHCILKDYFGVDGEPPVFGSRLFERRFRVPRAVFLRIYNDLKDRPFWKQRINATGKPQSHPMQKLVGAFRVLAYGECPDRGDEYVCLSQATIEVATKTLVEYLVDDLGSSYLRPPSDREVEGILARNSARGLPGCLGSLDCSHWKWTGCPKGRTGTYQDRNGDRTIVIEAVCDEDLWIYHMFVGAPGSLNNINVLYQSPLYVDITTGKWPPSSFPFTVNGNTRSLLYYLVDGTYPRFAFLVAPYPKPTTEQQRVFNRLQEAVRKDVERLFGVLTRRFHVMLHPARFFTVPSMVLTAQAVAILHNTVVEQRRSSFVSRTRAADANADAANADLGAGGAAAAAGGGAAAASSGGEAAAAVGAAAAAADGGAAAAAGGAGDSGEPEEGGAGEDDAEAGPSGEGDETGDATEDGGGDGAAAAGGLPRGGEGTARMAMHVHQGVGNGTGGGRSGEGGNDGGSGAGGSSAAAAAGANGGGHGATAGRGLTGGTAAAGTAAAADDIPTIDGTAPPRFMAAPDAPMSEYMRVLMATGRARDRVEHGALRDDLCHHVWKERGRLLAPYVQ